MRAAPLSSGLGDNGAEGLRASLHDSADELHIRRERTRLLAAFDRTLVPAERRGALRRVPWLVAAAALVVGLLVVWVVRSGARPIQESNLVVRVDGDAVWSEQRGDGQERVVLERGALWIHVDHSSSSQRRLVVVLPDGELEDRGTTFTVGADGARTTRVAVEDGQVVLRLRERPPVNVGPGETWTPDVPAPAACASAQPRPAAEASPAPPEAVPGVRSAQPSAPGASTHAADPAADFRVAMDAFDTGNDHGAAIKFGSFLEKHPRDPRAEDAAYLRVIALERCGDSAGVKLAAAEYLRRYPAGFRQAEVEQMGR